MNSIVKHTADLLKMQTNEELEDFMSKTAWALDKQFQKPDEVSHERSQQKNNMVKFSVQLMTHFGTIVVSALLSRRASCVYEFHVEKSTVNVEGRYHLMLSHAFLNIFGRKQQVGLR